MACFHPRTGYRSRTVNPSGKRSIVFNLREGYLDLTQKVPCGYCDGCRLEHSRQWAIRLVHEASLYPENCFVTLTYDNEHLPDKGTLVKKDLQDFLKKLRQRVRYYEAKNKEPHRKIRFFACGEYGESFFRPHYHLCLFNFDFRDRELYRSQGGNKLYTSRALEEVWPNGFSTIGALTWKSAAYVARYILKKQTGPSDHYYDVVDEETGEVTTLTEEFVTMSRRPGIARDWFERYKKDVFPDDFIVVNGKKLRPPKYYFQQIEVTDPSLYYRVKAARHNAATSDRAQKENTVDRLRVREAVLKSKLKLLRRDYEQHG